MQSYKDLDIYRTAHKLSIQIHAMSLDNMPKFEMYEEASQIRRCSKSIAATIVEGYGRKQYQQEFIKFLTYALASCDETREHLELLYETGSLKDKVLFEKLFKEYETLGRKLYKFRKAVQINQILDAGLKPTAT